jgi:hypothetical protein
MKRTLFAALIAGVSLSSQAAEPTKREAKDFITRLDATVERGNAQILSGKIDPVARRKHAQDLAALQNEGEKFGVLFTPFHKCNEASISAASSWQGLLGGNKQQFDNGIESYDKERQACLDALD